jgi:carbon-monoxide dehydrogenase medium subunit
MALRRARPGHLVDVQWVQELTGISRADGVLRIGAATRHRDIERDRSLPSLLRLGVRQIGNFEVRNRGTVGGSLAFADPAAEWPALALAMGAVIVAASVRGRREINAADLFVGAHATSLAADELLVEVLLPTRDARFGFAEATRRGPGDYALAGAVCHDATVTVFGTADRPQLLAATGRAAEEGRSGEAVVEIARSEIDTASEYRRHVAASLVGRVVTQARAQS